MDRVFLKRHTAARIGGLLLALLLMVLGNAADEAYGTTESISRFTGAAYTHNSAFANAIIVDGVDVSYVQKNNVDWEKAKADGVDFAIIRVGARGYGSSGKLISDDYYAENIRAAQDAGLMVGVYFFSQALDPLEAYAEANYTLELIEGFDLDLPVYMDYEFAGGSSGRLTNAQLSKIKMTENAEMFLETIEAAGYEAGFYANRNFLNNTVNGKSIGERWPVWVAQYNTDTDYTGEYHMWQYTSSGSVDGYGNRLDMNFMYLEETAESSSFSSIADCSVSITGWDSFDYEYGQIHEPSVRVRDYGSTLIEGRDYKVFYLKNANAGTGYVLVQGTGIYTDYQLVPFEIEPSDDLRGITVDRILNKYYTGEERVPTSLSVKDAHGNPLMQGLDYTFRVKDATEVGTATVTIDFIGNYSGTKKVTYEILPAKQSVTAEPSVYDVTLEDGAFLLEGIRTETDAQLQYTSSDSAVAEVDRDGMVTPVGPGTAEITITALASDTCREASAVVTVNVTRPQQKISVSSTSYTKDRLSKSFFLGAVAVSGAELSYESMDPAVAEVNQEGRVVLMGPGTTEIRITAPETDMYDAGEVRVAINVEDLDEESFAAKYERLKSGIENTKIVSVKTYPERKKVKLTWKKSNSGYAVEYYQVWRSVKKSSGYSKIYTTPTDSKKYYVNSKGLKAGTTYWYKVRGVRSLEGKLVYTPFTKVKVTTKK